MSRIFSLLLLAVSLLLAGCWGSGEANDKKSRNEAFAEVLRFDAPSSVTEIKSSWFFQRDAYIRWLRFSCDEPTLSKIKGLKKAKTGEKTHSDQYPGNSGNSSNPNAPDWWRRARVSPKDLDALEIYTSNTNSSESVDIWIETKTRTVYAMRRASQ
jgi:hypothetical protein